MKYTRSIYLVALGFCLALITVNLREQNEVPMIFAVAGAIACLFGWANSPGPVNVWRLQEKLMRISHQFLPDAPMLNRDSVLYVSMTLEELAETFDAQLKAIANHAATYARDSQARADHVRVLNHLRAHQKRMEEVAIDIRQWCAAPEMLELHVSLQLEDAVRLLDGVSDTMVTAAGLPLSMGLPGEDGYLLVQQSNASKANPETGLIDKTESGKWIKGEEYWQAETKLRPLLDDLYYGGNAGWEGEPV